MWGVTGTLAHSTLPSLTLIPAVGGVLAHSTSLSPLDSRPGEGGELSGLALDPTPQFGAPCSGKESTRGQINARDF